MPVSTAAGAATGQGLVPRPLGLIAAGGLIVGAALFAGDLALRAFVGHRLFPMAAPTSGIVLIVSWLTLAGAAFFSAASSEVVSFFHTASS